MYLMNILLKCNIYKKYRILKKFYQLLCKNEIFSIFSNLLTLSFRNNYFILSLIFFLNIIFLDKLLFNSVYRLDF